MLGHKFVGCLFGFKGPFSICCHYTHFVSTYNPIGLIYINLFFGIIIAHGNFFGSFISM